MQKESEINNKDDDDNDNDGEESENDKNNNSAQSNQIEDSEEMSENVQEGMQLFDIGFITLFYFYILNF